MNQEVYAKIEAILKDLKGNEFQISPDLSISNGLADDSVEVMEFIVTVEEEFDTEIPDDAVDQIDTIEKLVEFLSH